MIFFLLPDESGDSQLLEQARQGNKTALSEIYHLYVEAIYHYVRGRVPTTQIAEDITGAVFETLIDGLAKNKGPQTNVRAWLYQVARHQIADHYRYRNESVPLDEIEQVAIDTQSLDAQVLQALDVETIRMMIRSLSPDQQDVLLLRFDQQLSLRETAEAMGKKINTIKTLQLRALQKLRTRLQGNK